MRKILLFLLLCAPSCAACSGPTCLSDPPPRYYAGRIAGTRNYGLDFHCRVAICENYPCPLPQGATAIVGEK